MNADLSVPFGSKPAGDRATLQSGQGEPGRKEHGLEAEGSSFPIYQGNFYQASRCPWPSQDCSPDLCSASMVPAPLGTTCPELIFSISHFSIQPMTHIKIKIALNSGLYSYTWASDSKRPDVGNVTSSSADEGENRAMSSLDS